MSFTPGSGAVIVMRVDGAAGSRREIDTVASSMSNLSGTVSSALRNMAAAVGIGGGIAQMIQLSDQYAKFTSQLRLATQSQREYATAYSDVKRIAKEAQADLSGTGVLYARIANGTRELGVTQGRVAAITEVVNLALKISAATTAEAASAQLQLSQAFASGTLRGEEFNAVNEAAPRLMKALADGMGVPIGALKQLASDGKITSEVMATVLPNALQTLREEAKQVQTIAGAFTVLKNNMMEFTGIQSNANGSVAILTGAIGALANNLGLLMGVMSTMAGAKIASMLSGWAVSTYQSAAANRVLATSTLAAAVTSTEAASAIAAAKLVEAQANVRAAASAVALSVARVAELRSAILAAEGAAALAITTNGLIPAQARAIALAEAHAVALAAQAVAGNVATTTAIATTGALGAQAAAATFATRATVVFRGALGFLGGPIGAIVTLLGLGATAWSIWGKNSDDGAKQAKTTLADSTNEVVTQLQKQIATLNERNRLMGIAPKLAKSDTPASEQMRAITAEINRIEKSPGLASSEKVRRANELARQYSLIAGTVDLMTAAQKKNQNLMSNVKEAEWQGKNGTAAQKMAHDLAELEKEYGRVTPQMLAFVKAKYADKGAATTAKHEATAYTNLITSIGEKIAANKLEMNGYDKLSDAQKLTIKLDEAIISGKNKLSPAHIEVARAMIVTVDAQDKVIASHKRAAAGAEAMAKIFKDYQDDVAKSIENGVKEADKNEELVRTFGMTKGAIEQLELARLEEQLAQRSAVGMTMDEIATLEKLIEAKKRSATAAVKVDGLEAAKKAGEDLAKFFDPTKAQTFGEALKGAFGAAGESLSKLTSALQVYGIHQAEIDQARKNASVSYAGDAKGLAAASEQINRKEAQGRISTYGDMTGAAKGFFKEGTRGYKALEVAEKTFRTVELAMAVQTMLAKSGLVAAFTGLFVAGKVAETAATAASVAPDIAASMAKGTVAAAVGVAGQAQGDPYTAWPRMAAMAAAMAALGFAVMGGRDSGGGQSAAEVQKTQGAGSVFGDTDAKSESIARSIALASANSSIELTHTAGMLASLKNIERSMSGLTNLVVRTPGVVDGSNMGIQTAPLKNQLIGGAIGGALDSGWGTLFSPMLKLLNNLWGKTTKNIVDAGLQFGGSVRDLQSGQGFNQYASVDTTKSSWFGMSKKTSNSIQTQGISSELSSQFGLIFTNLEGALKSAAVAVGGKAEDVSSALGSLTIDVSRVSLKGLTGDALKQALNGVLSKTMDQMAEAAMPQMNAFRQVGEGYAETVMRVAANYANLDSILQAGGMTFGAVGINSIAAREKLIGLAGGIDKLADKGNFFNENFLTQAERLAPVSAYVSEEMKKLGLAGIDTRDKFKDLVRGIDKASPAGQQLYVTLMGLEEAFAKTHAAAEDLTKSQQQIADERKTLQDKLDDLTMTSTQLLGKQRGALDASNRGLFDQIQMAQKAKDAQDAAKTSLGTLVTGMKSFAASTKALTGSLLVGSLSTLTPMQQYAETRRQYAAATVAARAGDTAAQGQYSALASAYLTASQKVNASDAQYASDMAGVLKTNDEMSAWANGQIDVAQASLDALNAQVVGMGDLNVAMAGVARGIDNLPAAFAGAPVFDTQRYAAGSGAGLDVLVTEVKALQISNEALRDEVKGLRADQHQQAGDGMARNDAVTMAAAEAVVAGVRESAIDAAHARKNGRADIV